MAETNEVGGRIVVTTILNPPSLLVSLVDPAVTIGPEIVTRVMGSMHTSIPLEQVDGFVELLQKKVKQLKDLNAKKRELGRDTN